MIREKSCPPHFRHFCHVLFSLRGFAPKLFLSDAEVRNEKQLEGGDGGGGRSEREGWAVGLIERVGQGGLERAITFMHLTLPRLVRLRSRARTETSFTSVEQRTIK